MSHRISFVLAGTDFGPMILSRMDFATNPDGQVFGVGAQIFENCVYDFYEVELIMQMLKERHASKNRPVVFVDCGANIGAISIPVAKAIVDFGQVIAFECQNWLFYALCGNVALNNCWNFTPVMAAVGAENGTLNVPFIDYRWPASFGSIEMEKVSDENVGTAPDYEQAHTVQKIALDKFLGTWTVDFIKIDVEGMESQVLDGAEQIILRDKPDMLIEYIKSDRAALEARLQAWGYEVSEIGGNLLCIVA